MILTCIGCEKTSQRDPDGEAARIFEERGKLCGDCYTTRQIEAAFQATEIPTGNYPTGDGRRHCSFCEKTQSEVQLEWKLELVWRHDRTVTDGSRTVDAKRPLDQPEYACQSCINNLRHGLVQQGPTLL